MFVVLEDFFNSVMGVRFVFLDIWHFGLKEENNENIKVKFVEWRYGVSKIIIPNL